VHTAAALQSIDPRAPPLFASRKSPRADASENPVHLEDEVVHIEEHEDWRQEEEIL
jgi:hypothetical protein